MTSIIKSHFTFPYSSQSLQRTLDGDLLGQGVKTPADEILEVRTQALLEGSSGHQPLKSHALFSHDDRIQLDHGSIGGKAGNKDFKLQLSEQDGGIDEDQVGETLTGQSRAELFEQLRDDIRYAESCAEAQEYEGAIETYMDAQVLAKQLGLSFEEAMTSFNIAECFRAMGKIELSLKYFEQLLHLLQENFEGRDVILANAFSSYTEALIHLSKFDEAKVVIEKILAHDFSNIPIVHARAKFYQANMCFTERNFKEAIPKFEDGIEDIKAILSKGDFRLFPEDYKLLISSWTNLIHLYYQFGEFDSCLRTSEEALQKIESFGDIFSDYAFKIYSLRALAYGYKGEYDQAVEAYGQANLIAEKKHNPYYLAENRLNFAAIIAQYDLDEAIQILEQARSILLDIPELLRNKSFMKYYMAIIQNMGNLKEDNDDLQGAKQAYDEVLELLTDENYDLKVMVELNSSILNWQITGELDKVFDQIMICLASQSEVHPSNFQAMLGKIMATLDNMKEQGIKIPPYILQMTYSTHIQR